MQWQHSLILLAGGSLCSGSGAAATSAAFIPPRRQRLSNNDVCNMVQNPLILTSKVIANSPELGGDIIRIRTGPDEDDDEGAGFLTALGVPTFAVDASLLHSADMTSTVVSNNNSIKPKRLGLEGILRNPNAFVLENALSSEVCESILNLCENELKVGNYNAGKNNHGAMQLVIAKETADELLKVIAKHVDLEGVVAADKELCDEVEDGGSKKQYALAGIN